MGVDINTYRARIGSFMNRKIVKGGEMKGNEVILSWFVMIIIAILLIRGGVELNPGPVDVEIKNILESFRKEMVDRFEKAERKTEELHGDWKGLKNEVNVLGSQMQEVKKELVRIDAIEKELRSRNVVIYGMDSKHMENKYDTIYRLMEILINQLNMRIDEEVIDNCFWLGRRKGRRPLLVKFTRGYIRDEVLNRSRLLKGSRIWVEQDYDFGTIKTRRDLLPYLREARRNGKRATLRGNKLKLEKLHVFTFP